MVADAPNLVERVQFFNTEGARVGGFAFPGRASPRVAIGAVVLSGIGSLQFTGRSVLVSQPETGSLVTEYGLAGTPVRTFGSLRPTGHESDRNLHLALNTGLPLVNPAGGFYFVFLTGEPRFRKYGRDGNLEFERVVQGRELDPLLGGKEAPGTVWAGLASFHRHALENKRLEALQTVTPEFTNLVRDDEGFPIWMAESYAQLGEAGAAIDSIENAVEWGFISYPFLMEHDPFLASIRGEARFKKLMERVK